MKAQNLSPNIRTAIQEFLEIFAVPEVAPENIFYGNQNNLALPPEGNDYVIYSYISSVRHGTSAEDWEQDQNDDNVYLSTTTEVLVQVDCYASTLNVPDGIISDSRSNGDRAS
mgnify:CR=1 FL=1